jgi:general L-amino acid transport system substrate-binding protein
MRKFRNVMALLMVLGLVSAACASDDATNDTEVAATEATTAVTQAQGGGDTLSDVMARGELNCGVGGSAVGFSETQTDGSMTGLDADFCRAVAAAVLGDADAISFTETTAAERFEVLSSGTIDVLMRNTTFTQSRDTTLGLDFMPTTYFDGQGVMGKAEFGFTEDSTLADVEGAVLCTNAGTTTEKNITEGARLAGATIQLKTVESFPDAMEGFKAGDCDLVTTDASGLYGNRFVALANGEIADGDWVVFPRAPISKEPLGPVVRQNDSDWGDIVRWTIYAIFIADERGVTSANIDEVLAGIEVDADGNVTAGDPELARLFGLTSGELQTSMGLSADAFYNAVKQVGNYDEIFSRNLNTLGISRDGSPNRQWTDGGLIYAPPAR